MEIDTDELLNTYLEYVGKGMCAHAAWALVVNLASMRCKETGLDFTQTCKITNEISTKILKLWGTT